MGDESISDADKIRNKRLAKLGSQAQNTSSQNDHQGSDLSAVPSTRDNDNTSAQHADVPETKSLGAHKELKPDLTKPKISITKQSASSGASEPRDVSHGYSAKAQSTAKSPNDIPGQTRPSTPSSGKPKPSTSIDTWEDKTLTSVFRVTLKPETSQDSFGNALHYVPGVREDLEDQNTPLRMSTTVLDQAMLEAASSISKGTPLDYMLACWKRVSRQHRSSKASSQDDSKLNILKEARRLCLSYCIFAATIPDMFGQEPTESNPLVPHLLLSPDDERGLDHDFLAEAVARSQEDASIRDALVNAIEQISRQLNGKSMNDDFKPPMLALQNIVRYPTLVNALAQSPLFLPSNLPAQSLETSTLLGPFFAISPLQGDVTSNYFSSPQTIDRRTIISSQGALRMTLRTHQTDLLDVVNHFLRASKESRERVLDWFAVTVNSNHKRRALQVDNAIVSSDAFMVNVTLCLDQLCEPFMDASFSKIDRIDVDYLRKDPRIDIREETKINADQATSDQFYSRKVDGTSNFISEVFFLTLAAHHYGSEATISKLDQLEKDLRHIEKQLERLESERAKWVNTPHFTRFEDIVKRMKDHLEKGLSYKYAVQGVLFDDLAQARSMQFMRYAAVWLLRLAAPADSYPKQPPKLPLQSEQPDVVRCLPEYFLEDVIGNFKFIFRYLPHVITSTQSDELVILCITFLRSSEYVKNPYLKAGLVSILFHGIWPTETRRRGILGDLLNSLPFATEHLLHSLMKFYIEVENTGAHTQFYDKFNIRYEIFQIVKCVWSNAVYRDRLSAEARINLDFFVHFVNLLLNDVTFVLDESLNSFVKIHDLQEALKNTTLEQNERTEKEENLSQTEHQAKNYMQLTNETVAMLKLFTEALADSFTKPEIVQRLADMLDYNLDVMVGSKSSNLKVHNPAQYGFQPRTLLAEIVDVYLNLKEKTRFVEAVARDGRSYKPANFDKATVILSKHALKAPEEITAWRKLGEQFKEAKAIDDQAEEDLGEIPDEFLDPLMFTLMEDPVLLPTSKVTMDRSTIRSHLLSDPNDPFNRSPLKIEDVYPDEDRKAKIEAFKAQRKAEKAATRSDGTQPMDTS